MVRKKRNSTILSLETTKLMMALVNGGCGSGEGQSAKGKKGEKGGGGS